MAKLSDLANQLSELRAEKSDLKKKLKDIESRLSLVEEEMIEEMSHTGLSRMDVPGKGSFTISTRRFFRISDRDALVAFLHEQGDEDLMTVQHQTLNAYVNDLVERKEEAGELNFTVPGVVSTEKTQIRVRKN